MITISLDGNTLTPSEVMHIANGNAKVVVSSDAMARVHSARSVVERILSNDETVYGINTGFGALVHQRISSDDLTQLQVNLIRSHATAIGELMTKESVRAMMAVRINSLAKGHSGVHPDVLEQIVHFLNNDITNNFCAGMYISIFFDHRNKIVYRVNRHSRFSNV